MTIRTLIGLLAALCVWFVPAPSLAGDASPDELPVVRVGVLYDGDWALLDELVEATRAELDVLVEGEFRVEYPPAAQRDGQWDLEFIIRSFRELLADDEVDIVVTAGLAGSQIACLDRDGYDKPVIAPLSLDYEIQDLPRRAAGSGVRNLTYVGMPSTLRGELETFRELVPFQHVAFIANRRVIEAMPQIQERTLEQLDGVGLRTTYVSADRDAASALEAIPSDADVVYVWPLLLDAGERAKLIEGLNRRGLPSFSRLGREEVDAGMFATLSPDAGRTRLARRVALDIQQILLGTPAEELAVEFEIPERLIVNVATSRRVRAWPRFEVMLEAELVGDDGGGDLPELTLFDAVHRAIDANRGLAAERMSVEAALADLDVARSRYRPSLDASLSAARVDRDRAAASGGSLAERTTTGGASVSQLLYSDEALAGIAIERSLRRSRDASYEQASLDVALDASIAYLDVLRAETQVVVRRTNLELTRGNLELARSRRRIGTGGQAEIYRWESQIANDRRNLVDAAAAAGSARVELNRLLHEPLDREFRTVDIRPDDIALTPGSGLLDGFVETPLQFRAMTAFVVVDGLASAPELRAIDASIEAQRRAAKAARRANRLPTVAASAGIDETLDTAGAGAGVIPPGVLDDTAWSIGVNATIPLYSGGARRAERRQAELEVARLELERAAAAELVESTIRSSLVQARASFTSIRLARDAASAARSNLELVQDAYARGALPVIDLIDAQSSALSAELSATDAVYDFFIDLMRVQRSSSRFDFFTTPEERRAWIERLRVYFGERDVPIWGEP